ncbi:hypothetical protein [Streptomyces sp. 900105755]
MSGADGRLVHTAVIGGPKSGQAIILPTDADELVRWRRRHPNYTYWCGTQLGGCGNELSDRLYRDKVCHFAHRPHTSCHRTATGAASADHLFIRDDLAAWADRRKLTWQTVARNLGSGPGDAVDFSIGTARRQHVRFQFSRLEHTDWRRDRRRLSREAATLDWVFGPGAAHPETTQELYDDYGYVLRFRFETHGAVRHIRLRAEDSRHSTEWVPLDACTVTPEGLRLSGVEPRRRESARLAAGASAGHAPVRGERSREEQARALEEALVSAARLGTRPTWEELARTAGNDLLELPVQDRADLLITVERTRGGASRPLLSALIRTEEGDPPEYVADVVAAAGCGTPATTAVLKRWCKREAYRAFAVYGVPSRKPPHRLVLTPGGWLPPRQEEADQRLTFVRAPDRPVLPPTPRRMPGSSLSGVLLKDEDIHRALRRERRRSERRPEHVADLLLLAAEALTRLPERQRSLLTAEMAVTRLWLKDRPDTKTAEATAGKRGKKPKNSLQGARPLPGFGDTGAKKKRTT